MFDFSPSGIKILKPNIMSDYQEQRSQSSIQAPPPNYLVWAILTTIFCCLPLGVVSIVFAAQVNSRWHSGDIEGARLYSKNAKLWAWIAFGVGIAGVLIWSLLAILGVITGLGTGILESW
jgi:hypothetical protein